MKKSFSVIIAVLLVVALSVGSAFAFTSPVRNYSSFALNPDNTSRVTSLSGTVRYGVTAFGTVANSTYSKTVSSVTKNHSVISGGVDLTSQTSGTVTGNNDTVSGGIYVSSGTYFDYQVPLDYSITDVNRLILAGTFKAYLQAYTRVRNGSSGDWYTSMAYAYPDTCEVYINDEFVVAIPVSGTVFNFEGIQYDSTEDVYSVVLRFNYSSAKYASGSIAVAPSTVPFTTKLVAGFTDNVVINTEFITPETPVYQSQLNEVISWLNSINLGVSYTNGILSSILESLGDVNSPDSALNRLASIFARDDDIELRDQMDDTLKEATDIFYNTTDNPSTSVSKDTVQEAGETLQGMSSMFNSGYNATDAFQELSDSKDDFLSWFSTDTSSWLDTAPSTYSLEDDPYNMWMIEQQYAEIAQKRGEGN